VQRAAAHVVRIHIDRDAGTSAVFRDFTGRAATAENIADKITRVSDEADEKLWQLFREPRGVRQDNMLLTKSKIVFAQKQMGEPTFADPRKAPPAARRRKN
jgi:hypothetical protein